MKDETDKKLFLIPVNFKVSCFEEMTVDSETCMMKRSNIN